MSTYYYFFTHLASLLAYNAGLGFFSVQYTVHVVMNGRLFSVRLRTYRNE